MNLVHKGYLYTRRNLSKRFGMRSGRKWLMESGMLSDEEKTLLNEVSLKVHHRDSMYSALGGRHYLSVGLSAIRCIGRALGQSSRMGDIHSILDFPCGYGRVVRFLRMRFPDADITGGEIIPGALRFCEKHFSITPLLSRKSICQIALPKAFDLVWCGSLITHLDMSDVKELLTFFHRHLNLGGLCIFTTQGQASADWIREKKITYKLSEKAQKKILRQFYSTGFGYADYENRSSYGISLASRNKIREIASEVGEWGEIFFQRQGWDNHQDVYGFSR